MKYNIILLITGLFLVTGVVLIWQERRSVFYSPQHLAYGILSPSCAPDDAPAISISVNLDNGKTYRVSLYETQLDTFNTGQSVTFTKSDYDGAVCDTTHTCNFVSSEINFAKHSNIGYIIVDGNRTNVELHASTSTEKVMCG